MTGNLKDTENAEIRRGGQPALQRRFRIVKLEERIAPRKSPKPTDTCSDAPTCYCNYSMTNCNTCPW